MTKTALQQLIQWGEQMMADHPQKLLSFAQAIDKAEELLELERHQHGQTWDAAIHAHDARGHVYARSMCDFDLYWLQIRMNNNQCVSRLGPANRRQHCTRD